MRETTTFSVSLPPAMAKQVEQAMKAEHRTRSELVREALRVYFSVRLMPVERPHNRRSSGTLPGSRRL
jgi:metal-responsive CopG/Arc/MetJ family transcriptional regulator